MDSDKVKQQLKRKALTLASRKIERLGLTQSIDKPLFLASKLILKICNLLASSGGTLLLELATIKAWLKTKRNKIFITKC